MSEKKHPIQPLETDPNGVLRFKRNAIVCYLLEKGSFDMNHLAAADFSREDREQFAQLIGYSVSGFSDLSYASPVTAEAAMAMFEENKSEDAARVEALEEELEAIKAGLHDAVMAAFGIDIDEL